MTSRITTRRTILAAGAALAVAATLVTGAAIAMPAPDPIFAAIEAHRAACAAFDLVYAPVRAAWPVQAIDLVDVLDFDHIHAVADLETAATNSLLDTAPTTRGGLRALEAHLTDERSYLLRHLAWQRLNAEGHRFPRATEGREFNDAPVAMFLARHAAALGVV